jgi:TatA/E family protein of Tat protein translocase
MGTIGVPEMIFIFVLALLIFGPKKLPELGRSLGKGIAEFRRASNELRSSLEREMSTLEQETRLDEPPASAAQDSAAQDPSKTDTAKGADTHTDEYDNGYGGYSGEQHS